MAEKEQLRFFSCLFLVLVSLAKSSSNFLDNILQENGTDDALVEMYIPTIRAQNEICRNHSLYYLRQLKNFTLWATEMFDATTKFPSGILYGSSYDLGNFDECLELKIPYIDHKFYGKYCMAKFTLEPPPDHATTIGPNIIYENRDYTSYYNISVWKKIRDYLADELRNPRNEITFAFCMPSSCTRDDLQKTLRKLVNELNENNNFKLKVHVDGRNCQVHENNSLDAGDILFLSVVAFLIAFVTFASIYDLLIRRDDYAQFKFRECFHHPILCFSFQRNFNRLTATGNNVDGLNCMAGMKVYSMFMIILLHRSMYDFGSAIINPIDVERKYSKFELTLLLNGPIVVDTFFTISGFLATYLTLYYYYKKTDSGVKVLLIYLHRFIRMVPTYGLILVFYCTLFVKMGSGPLWQERVGKEQEKCRHSWWANMLFINNYVDTKNYCMFQSWYMACDMNAFMFVPIICLMLFRKPKAGIMAIFALIIASTIAVFATVYILDEMPILILNMKILLSPETYSTFLLVYIPGHLRAAPYFTGVLAGYLKYRMNIDNLKIPRKWLHVGWIACFPLMFAACHTAFAFYVMKVSPAFSALYACLYHLLWSIGISWMLIAISSGYGPWIEPILTWSPVVLLSRLTYTVYLCHGAIQLYTAGTIRKPNFVSVSQTVHSGAADIILAYILAFVLTMFVEAPFVGLEKILFWTDKNKNNGNKKDGMELDTEIPTAN